MMAGRFSFSNFFGVGDDQFDDPEQTAQAAPRPKRRRHPTPGPRQKSYPCKVVNR